MSLIWTTWGNEIVRDWGRSPVVIQNVFPFLKFKVNWFFLLFNLRIYPSITFDAGWFSSLDIATDKYAPVWTKGKSFIFKKKFDIKLKKF